MPIRGGKVDLVLVDEIGARVEDLRHLWEGKFDSGGKTGEKLVQTLVTSSRRHGKSLMTEEAIKRIREEVTLRRDKRTGKLVSSTTPRVSRPERDLQIWLADPAAKPFGSRLVGHLRNGNMSTSLVQTVQVGGIGIALKRETRTVVYDCPAVGDTPKAEQAKELYRRHLFKTHNIPENAEWAYNAALDERTITWPLSIVTQDVFEDLFDHPSFLPL